MHIALKVDVTTLRGTREGVPNLVEILRRHGVGATFLWSLGPDIARRAGDVLRATRDAGFEVGVYGIDPVGWERGVGAADAAWTRAELEHACERFAEIFKEPPRVRGAPGWRTNIHAMRLTQTLGFDYCSDGRGRFPHLPVWRAELIRCPQFPTTLPTLGELCGRDGITAGNVAAHLLEATREPVATGHVFTLRAALDGLRFASVFDQLLAGWKAQGWTVGPLRALYEAVEPMALPRCEVAPAVVPGRRAPVLVQGDEFLANVDLGQRFSAGFRQRITDSGH